MPKIKGGKLKAKEIKDFLQASYEKKPPDELDGYILDKSLSNDTAKVYYNPQTNHAVVAHRGTKGALDWGNNLAYVLGAYEYTNRYKKGKSVQDKAEKKYGKSNISTLGHSQGSVLTRKLGADTKEVINVNPAYTFEKPAKNEYNIRSSTDIVSGLYAPVAKTREYLFPKYSEKHDITIPSKSATDILGEHSYSILDRLGDKEIGVGAGNKISHYNIMKGGRTHRLGYSFDDIDFIGGTNNNCGAVGTAHINRGYTPIGVIGGDRGGGQTLQRIADEARDVVDFYGNLHHFAHNTPNFGERAFQARNQHELDRVYRDINDWATESGYHYDHPQMNLVARAMNNAVNRNNLRRPDDVLLMRDRNWLANDAIRRANAVVDRSRNAKPFNPPDVRPKRGGALSDSDSESDSDSDSESSSDEEMYNEVKGGKIKNPFKSVSKAFSKVGKAFEPVGDALSKGAEYANPMMWALKDKGTSEAMAKSGEITHDYLLPAVVSAGKPIYDATAMTASTMLTGNPVLGKAVADTLWNQMVAKPGYDPRQNQKSAELGELSETFGKAVSKPYSASLGGMGRGDRTIWEKLYDIVNPADDFDVWKERQKGRRISKANRARIEAEHEALMMRQRANEMEAKAKADHERELQIANQIGEFEEIGDDEADRAREHFERKQMGDEDTEGKIARDDADYVSVGKVGKGRKKKIDFEDVKWGTFTRMFQEFKRENPKARVKDLEAFAHRIIKNKSKFSPKAFKKAQFYLNVLKKGGASTDQIGLANEMRTFSKADNATYYALSDLSHSADNPENPGVKDLSVVFRNLNTKDRDPRADQFLQALYPSYLRQKYYVINRMKTAGTIDPAEADYLIGQILSEDPRADREIKGYNTNWGVSNPLVRRIYAEVEAVNPKAQQARVRRERAKARAGT